MTSYTQPSKNTPTYSNPDVPITNPFLLREDGGHLLRESGDRIIIGVAVTGSVYTRPTLNSASYSNPTRN